MVRLPEVLDSPMKRRNALARVSEMSTCLVVVLVEMDVDVWLR